jgi:hypothetical protein
MPEPARAQDVAIHSVSEIERYAAWVLGMTVGVAVFFQAHVALPGGVINLNLADPFAILTLAAVSLHVLFVREPPAWRIRQLNYALGAISLLLLLSFLHGWSKIGVTQWALVGRLLGWFVLLGYLSAGYLIVANVGTHGLRRLSETLISTGAVIVLLQVVLRLLDQWGVETGARLTSNFQGYAGNRNAFAFQLLVIMALLLGYSEVYARGGAGASNRTRRWVFSLLLGVLLAAQVWTGSRVGMFAAGMTLLLAWFGRLADRRILWWGTVIAGLFWFCIWLVLQQDFFREIFHENNGPPMSNSLAGSLVPEALRDSPSSNEEHRQTMLRGIELWTQSPVLGAGLGVFHAMSPQWLGYPQVIHNTPLWILAEFGLLGGAAVGWGFFLLARHAIRFGKTQPARRILFLLLAAFSMFSLAHEIFYQRIFWLVLGAVLAKPGSARIGA